MKLIMENWRGYLCERKTDIFYQKFVQFYANLLKNHWNEYYDVEEPSSPVAPERCPDEPVSEWPGKPRNITQTVPGSYPMNRHDLESARYEAGVWFRIDPKDDVNVSALYRKYIQETGDNGVFIIDEQMFGEIFSKFDIEISHPSKRDEKCGAGGDMDSDGTMRIFGSYRGRFYNKPDLNKVLSALTAGRTFAHELGHWANSFRSQYTLFREPSANPDQWAVGTKGYAQSTEELQARITAVINDLIENFLLEEPDEAYDSDFQNDIATTIEESDPKEFIILMLSHYGAHLHWNELTGYLDFAARRRWRNAGYPVGRRHPSTLPPLPVTEEKRAVQSGVRPYRDPYAPAPRPQAPPPIEKSMQRIIRRLYEIFEFIVKNKDKYPGARADWGISP